MIRLPYRFLYIVVFVSGALAIVYQTAWFRLLSLILGSTSLALTLILTAFMLGLGLGGYLFGKIADRWNARRLYQILEGGIGLFALLSMVVISPVNVLYGGLSHALDAYPALLVAAKFLLSLLFVLGPTLFMGGTMPVAVRYLVLDSRVKGREISTFYWINTLGAAGMAVAMPLFFMVRVTIPHLLLFAACGNALLVLFVFLLPNRTMEATETGAGEDAPAARLPRLPLLAFFLSGAASLALETLWNRHLILIFGGSIYTFGFILGIYLLGIVVGSIIYTWIRKDEEHALRLYAWSLSAASLYIMVTLFFLPRLALYHLEILSHLGLSFGTYHLANMMLLLIFVFPVTLCFGIAFPAAIHGLTRRVKELGRDTGILYGVNSVGTASGPILMTFLILPFLNFRGSYYAVVLLLLLSVIVMALSSIRRLSPAMAGIILVTFILGFFHSPIDQVDFLVGTAKSPQPVVKRFTDSGGRIDLSQMRVLYARNDIEANVIVARYPDGTRSLVINGKNDASDGTDMFTQSLSGHIPFLTNRTIKKAMVIGLGSGVTSHAVLTHDVKSVESIEISPAVIEAARTQFAHVNELCFSDPRSTVIAADGRNYLTYTDERYDLIISEPSNPWLTGVSSLFTRQFFEIVHSRLNPGGILCQWTNLYNLNVNHVFNILKTVELTFPHIVTFFIPESMDMLMIASDRPIPFNPLGVETFPKRAREQLASLDITSSEQIFDRLMWSSKDLADKKATLPPNSDTYPWLELLAPRDRFFTKPRENLLTMLKFNATSTFRMAGDPEEIIAHYGVDLPIHFLRSEALARTFYPWGSSGMFFRFTGYRFPYAEGELLVRFGHHRVDMSDLIYYAHQFTSDPFAREGKVKLDGQAGYGILSDGGTNLTVVSKWPGNGRVFIFTSHRSVPFKDLEAAVADLAIHSSGDVTR